MAKDAGCVRAFLCTRNSLLATHRLPIPRPFGRMSCVTATAFARRLWPILTCVALAVWLGSLAHTLLSVATLFAAFPKNASNVAVEAAPLIFAATEKALLATAAVGLIAIFAWRRCACSRPRRWASYAMIAATVLLVAQAAIVSPKMEALRADGEGSSATFKRLHGASSAQYLAQTLCVLIATALLPAALREGDACAMA